MTGPFEGSTSLGEMLAQLAAEDDELRNQVAQFCDGLVSHLVLDGRALVVALAGLKNSTTVAPRTGCALSPSTVTPRARPTSRALSVRVAVAKAVAAGQRFCTSTLRRLRVPAEH
jgi:hypothetical protein